MANLLVGAELYSRDLDHWSVYHDIVAFNIAARIGV
jgi:hypothetical protein